MSAPPPLYERHSSSLVVHEGARRNTAPLGALQLGGRREYDFEGSVRADPPATVRAPGGGINAATEAEVAALLVRQTARLAQI
jgi:hypothetical protein